MRLFPWLYDFAAQGRVTGEVHHVDGGYNIVGMPQAQDLNELTAEIAGAPKDSAAAE